MARAMKDSGVNWIRQIPSGWNVANLRHNFAFGKGLPITKENLRENGIAVISYGQIHSKSNSGTGITRELIRYVDREYLLSNPDSLVHEDDFIFADTSEDLAGCGNFVYVDKEEQLFAGYHTIILRHKADYVQKYYAFLFLSDAWRSQIRERVTGVKLFSISQKILREASILVPPIAEQSRIAAFLDDQCARVDSVIAQTSASIEEYKKLKQAVITQAVTKGIRPNRKMKDSGTGYIGEIPADWNLKKLRYFGVCQNGISKAGEYFGRGYPFVSYSDVYKNIVLPLVPDKLVESTEAEQRNYSVQRGDIFFTRTSETIEEVGFTSVCKRTIEKATFAGFVIRVRPFDDTLLTDFAKYYFRSDIHRRYFVKEMNLVTRASLGQDLLKAMPVLVPDRCEQQEIIDYLDKKIAEIDSLIDRKAQLLSELKNYKKSLIFEYVTGKKEVLA